MLTLLPYKFKIISKWCISIGILFSFLSGFMAGCSSPESGVNIDYGQGLFAIGVILYIVSRDKTDDEYLNFLKLQAGAIVVLVTIIYSIIEEYFVAITIPLSYIITFQFILYYFLFNLLKSNPDRV